MDPDKNLSAQQQLSHRILDLIDKGVTTEGPRPDLDHVLDYARQLAEHVEALDEWIRMGGFLPAVWREA